MQVEASGVRSIRDEKLGSTPDKRLKSIWLALKGLKRTGRYGCGWDAPINDPIDKRGVGAVLQQPPNEISKKVSMRTDRRIDAAPCAYFGMHQVVQHLAHSMQALKLES